MNLRVPPMSRAPLALAGAMLLSVSLLAASTQMPAPRQQPTAPPPQAASPSGAFNNDVRVAASELPQLRSLLVSHRGDLVAEYYARGVRPTTPANIKSASKSIIATLVGVALDRRLIPSLREPIVTYFPELRQDRDPRKQAITIEDLLTMRAGLESTSGQNYGAWVLGRNWVQYALARPMVATPGDVMQYSTGTSHLLSAILTKATKRSTWQLANEALGQPIGISIARWPQDPQGIYFGGNDMLLTPRQMVALGELYRRRGLVNGRQVVPAAWVDQSCIPRTSSRFDADRRYGYGWWIQEFGADTACFAWGYGGQYIFVFRDLDLVVTATSSTSVSEDRHGHRRLLFDVLERVVLPRMRAM